MKRRNDMLALSLGALLLCEMPCARAAEQPAAPVAATMQVPPQPDALGTFNGYMHGFNLWVWDTIDRYGPALGAGSVPDGVRRGMSNVLLNLVNEPTTMISWLVVGDYHNAGISAERFWINMTRGWLGAVDMASREGITSPHIDIGLALCARGVGEGGYIVLPFVGPRTFRDGLSDFLLVNALTYLALSPIIGFPPSPEAFVIVEVGEEAGRIAVVRQIDHADDRNRSLESVRDEYLRSRRERCRQVTEMLNAQETPE